ncbi:MAG: hypothetical protein PHH30_07675 [Bacteroidales bacterium]|nr:hypothetical protein [Bacteroidales bacterium]MDD3858829.1 hypothetical protein [Bacteroidales bacterium]
MNFAWAILLLACFSCEDSTEQSVLSTENCRDEEIINLQEELITKEGDIGPWRKFVPDNGYGIACCNAIVDDCFPVDITIFPEHVRTINSIFSVIGLGNQVYIQNAFLVNQAILELYIDPTLVQGVINGTVIVECNLNGASGQRYMIFKDLSGNIIAVYPLI